MYIFLIFKTVLILICKIESYFLTETIFIKNGRKQIGETTQEIISIVHLKKFLQASVPLTALERVYRTISG